MGHKSPWYALLFKLSSVIAQEEVQAVGRACSVTAQEEVQAVGKAWGFMWCLVTMATRDHRATVTSPLGHLPREKEKCKTMSIKLRIGVETQRLPGQL